MTTHTVPSGRDRFTRHSLACLLAILLDACGSPTEAVGTSSQLENTSSVSNELSTFDSNTQYWSVNNNVVDICWTNAGFAQQKEVVRNAVMATWGAFSGLTFTWPTQPATAVCPPPPIPAHYMPITLLSDPIHPVSAWGRCAPGFGGRNAECVEQAAECQCYFTIADADANPDFAVAWVAVHEIGHGLGMIHEHQRPDRPTDIIATCVDHQTPNVWATNWDYLMLEEPMMATVYDGLDSVMSYCMDRDRDGQTDRNTYTADTAKLGPLDALGIEMLYPRNFGRKPVVAGFGNANGSEFIVREGQSVQLNVDWVTRGALPVVSTNRNYPFHNVHWRAPSGVFSAALAPTRAFATTELVEVELDDMLLRHHPWTGTTVVPSNAQHTAIVLSLLE